MHRVYFQLNDEFACFEAWALGLNGSGEECEPWNVASLVGLRSCNSVAYLN